MEDRRVSPFDGFVTFLKKPDQCLRRCEVSRGHQGNVHMLGHGPTEHFAGLGEVVDACVGAGVGHENEPFVQAHSDAIGHSVLSVLCSFIPASGLLLNL